MADKQIEQLDDIGSLDGTEVLPVQRAGTTGKTTLDDVKSFILPEPGFAISEIIGTQEGPTASGTLFTTTPYYQSGVMTRMTSRGTMTNGAAGPRVFSTGCTLQDASFNTVTLLTDEPSISLDAGEVGGWEAEVVVYPTGDNGETGQITTGVAHVQVTLHNAAGDVVRKTALTTDLTALFLELTPEGVRGVINTHVTFSFDSGSEGGMERAFGLIELYPWFT